MTRLQVLIIYYWIPVYCVISLYTPTHRDAWSYSSYISLSL